MAKTKTRPDFKIISRLRTRLFIIFKRKWDPERDQLCFRISHETKMRRRVLYTLVSRPRLRLKLSNALSVQTWWLNSSLLVIADVVTKHFLYHSHCALNVNIPRNHIDKWLKVPTDTDTLLMIHTNICLKILRDGLTLLRPDIAGYCLLTYAFSDSKLLDFS